MSKAWLNHVSIGAEDLDESTRFYVEIFGASPLPAPNFGMPVRWLRVGDIQVHLFVRSGEMAPTYNHVAFAVEDFEAVFWATKGRGLHDYRTFGHYLRELPGNIAQMYIRDPAGNLIEVDWHDAKGLDPAIRREMQSLMELFPQTPANLEAALFLEPRPRPPSA
jgi:catechol 2,3-dioxygenase-like lactoylglutathione lyase family enzyme